MPDQEQVTKVNVYAAVGPPANTAAVTKVAIYAIVNNNVPPVPPPPKIQIWIYG